MVIFSVFQIAEWLEQGHCFWSYER